jgi:uncharacterized protein (TIGR02147 family)
MKKDEIYSFDDPTEILTQVFHEKTKRNPLFSIRAWSRQLGFKNPSHMADVLNRRRNLTIDFGLRISPSMGLNDEERTYFETLVFLKNSKTASERAYFDGLLKRLKPDNTKKTIAPEKHDFVKDWYYGVLDEMTCLSDFTPDPNYLAKRLGPEITPQAVAVALTDLIRLGSIEQSSKGKLSRPKKAYFTQKEVRDQLEDTHLRTYQRKFIEKSLIALDEQTTDESFFRMTNIPIKLKKFREFRNQIEDFALNLNHLESPKDADEVYQLCIQFCRITKKVT